MEKTKTTEDYFTKALHDNLVFGNIVGVAVDWDEETGEKYYGLRITRVDARISPMKRQEYILWFIRDEEGNGPGSFQIQTIG